MTTRIFLFLYFTFISISLLAQDLNQSKIDIEILRNHYYELLNKHRDSLRLSKLSNNTILNQAALDQAEYCNKNDKLSHFQESKLKISVMDRIKFYKGNFNIVGENCLMTFINIPIYSNHFGKNIIIKNYKELAESMFYQWKNSPGHYKNMITPQFENSGFNIVVKNNKVYGVEVFSCKEYIQPMIFSSLREEDYGLDENYDFNCTIKNKLNKSLIDGLVNYTILYSDTVKQYYENIKDIKSIFKLNNDGLAIDIVLKDQFSCVEDNRLNPKFYDGHLLAPIYKDTLLSRNKLGNDEFLSTIGNLPKVFLNKSENDFQLNTIYISNGKPCLYSYPVSIESDYLPIVNITPILSSTSKQGSKEYKANINLVKNFDIPFEVSSSRVDSVVLKRFLLFLSVLDPLVESININIYSSIEGNSKINEQLHKRRSNELIEIIAHKLKNKPIIHIKSEENWNLFYEQLTQINRADSIKEKTKFELRKFINNNKQDFKILLDEQRIAKLSFKLKTVELKSNSIANQILLLDHYIDSRNANYSIDLFNQLVLDYKTKKIESDYLSFINTPDVNFDSFVTTNYLASLILRINKESKLNLREDEMNFLRDVLALKSNYSPLMYNQIVLKTSLFYYGYLDSLEDFKRIENSIFGLKINSLYAINEIDGLEYNYYLTASKYYYEKRKFPLMYEAYNKFKSKLKLQNLNDEETIDIALYMNSFHDLYTSINLLESRIKKSDSNEKLKFLYISTGALYCFNNKYKIDFYLSQLDSLIKMDSKFLCPWLNDNFQLLRIDEIKSRICKKCKFDF